MVLPLTEIRKSEGGATCFRREGKAEIVSIPTAQLVGLNSVLEPVPHNISKVKSFSYFNFLL